MTSLRFRLLTAAAVAAIGLIYILPSLFGEGSAAAKFSPASPINLGLDLKGGVHLTVGVDIETAMANSLAQNGQDIRSMAREDGLVVLRPSVDKGVLNLLLADSAQQEKLDALLAKSFGNLKVLSRTAQGDGKVAYALAMTQAARRSFEAESLEQAVKIIRNRADEFGVAEPDIRKQEGNRIQVQLPGLDDPERAKRNISRTAHLEFKIVDDAADLAKAAQGILPPGRELIMLQSHRNVDGVPLEQPLVVFKDAALTGERITNAYVGFDSTGPYVGLHFDAQGARIFTRVTGENVGKRLAIILDGKASSAPVIQDRIAGGRATITGRFTDQEAHDLAGVLRSGALPAPINILEERTVGPSLGQESIDKGLFAGLIGAALVVVFMVAYYGMSGVIADLALTLNIMLIMAGLAAFGATLTMPGIAGIVLTIGMAVDANVIIFERIREELRRGLTVKAAIEEGFSRATVTILDANITTVIAAAILYQFGTGPVRGFAVTLILGIISSMFTAIFVSRIIFDLWTARKDAGAALSI
ncbi:MAG: protein translocase subunit SecD [Thermodesulfobacteriota bacterium]